MNNKMLSRVKESMDGHVSFLKNEDMKYDCDDFRQNINKMIKAADISYESCIISKNEYEDLKNLILGYVMYTNESWVIKQRQKERFEREIMEAVEQANRDAIVEDSGAIRWKSNGRYLMDDFCKKLEYANYNFSRKETKIARDIQNEISIANYKANYKGPSEEELMEMRAVFGAGSTIIDVITGNEIQL